jgi:hypothetical protein
MAAHANCTHAGAGRSHPAQHMSRHITIISRFVPFSAKILKQKVTVIFQPYTSECKTQHLVVLDDFPKQNLAIFASKQSDQPLRPMMPQQRASSVPDAVYCFVRHEPGVDVVLFGTGDPEHLRTNIASILKPPLPAADRERLAELFGHLVGVGLDAPHLSRPRSAAS